MLSTMSYDRGTLLLARFPDVEGTQGKLRPVLVLSSVTYQQAGSDLIVALITSNIRAPMKPGDHLISDWQAGGLARPSRIRARVSTIHQASVVRVLGELPPDDFEAFQTEFEAAMDLCR